jgi:hypothetical protein
VTLEHLQDFLYFISTLSLFQQLFIYLKSNTLQHYSLFYLYFYYFILTFFFFFFFLSLLISCLPLNPPRSAQTTTPDCHWSITHATNISRSATHNPKPPPASHPRHKHLKIDNPTTTPTAPPPGRDRQANPRRANPKDPMKKKITRANLRRANPKHPMKKKITRANP